MASSRPPSPRRPAAGATCRPRETNGTEGGAEGRGHGLGGSNTAARASAPTTKLTIELLEYSSSGAESQIAIEEDGAQWDGAYQTSHFTGVSTGGKTIEVFKRYVIRIQGEVGGGAAGNRMVIQSLTISWNPS